VTPYSAQRIACAQTVGQFGQLIVLGLSEGQVIRAFKFDADRKIIAAFAPCKN